MKSRSPTSPSVSTKAATRWYERAAEGGSAEAQFALADLLARTRHEPEDLIRAHVWANLSAATGHEGARALRDELKQRMSRSQIATAQSKARARHRSQSTSWSAAPASLADGTEERGRSRR